MEAVTFKKLVKGHAYSVTAAEEVREGRRNRTSLLSAALFFFLMKVVTF